MIYILIIRCRTARGGWRLRSWSNPILVTDVYNLDSEVRANVGEDTRIEIRTFHSRTVAEVLEAL